MSREIRQIRLHVPAVTGPSTPPPRSGNKTSSSSGSKSQSSVASGSKGKSRVQQQQQDAQPHTGNTPVTTSPAPEMHTRYIEDLVNTKRYRPSSKRPVADDVVVEDSATDHYDSADEGEEGRSHEDEGERSDQGEEQAQEEEQPQPDEEGGEEEQPQAEEEEHGEEDRHGEEEEEGEDGRSQTSEGSVDDTAAAAEEEEERPRGRPLNERSTDDGGRRRHHHKHHSDDDDERRHSDGEEEEEEAQDENADLDGCVDSPRTQRKLELIGQIRRNVVDGDAKLYGATYGISSSEATLQKLAEETGKQISRSESMTIGKLGIETAAGVMEELVGVLHGITKRRNEVKSNKFKFNIPDPTGFKEAITSEEAMEAMQEPLLRSKGPLQKVVGKIPPIMVIASVMLMGMYGFLKNKSAEEQEKRHEQEAKDNERRSTPGTSEFVEWFLSNPENRKLLVQKLEATGLYVATKANVAPKPVLQQQPPVHHQQQQHRPPPVPQQQQPYVPQTQPPLPRPGANAYATANVAMGGGGPKEGGRPLSSAPWNTGAAHATPEVFYGNTPPQVHSFAQNAGRRENIPDYLRPQDGKKDKAGSSHLKAVAGKSNPFRTREDYEETVRNSKTEAPTMIEHGGNPFMMAHSAEKQSKKKDKKKKRSKKNEKRVRFAEQ